MLKIIHATYSTAGGAGASAQKLSAELRSVGIDSRVVSLTSSNLRRSWARSPRIALAAARDAVLKSSPDQSQISLLRARVSNRQLFESVDASTIIHLHWPFGMLTIEDIESLARRSAGLVWTLHDERAATGGCHFSFGCKLWVTGCRQCPQVRPLAQAEVENVYKHEAAVLEPSAKIVFSSPSPRLAEPLQKKFPWAKFLYIPNVLPVRHDSSEKQIKSVDASREGLVIAASDLLDPRKRVREILIALESAGLLESVSLVGRGGDLLAQEFKGPVALGTLDPKAILELFSTRKYLLFASRGEVAPNVIFEALVCGLPVLMTSDSGLDWIIDETRGVKTFPTMSGLVSFASIPGSVTETAIRYSNSDVVGSYVSLYSELGGQN